MPAEAQALAMDLAACLFVRSRHKVRLSHFALPSFWLSQVGALCQSDIYFVGIRPTITFLIRLLSLFVVDSFRLSTGLCVSSDTPRTFLIFIPISLNHLTTTLAYKDPAVDSSPSELKPSI